MAKTESNFINMVLTLLLVTAISSTALGFIYELTKGPIADSKKAKKNNAIIEVVPEFNNKPVDEMYSIGVDGDTLRFYPAKNNDKLIGTAISTFTNKGFGGNIKLMIGLLPDGKINNIVVLEHKETPGLGDKMQKSKSNFSVQFNGKNPEDFQISVIKDGGDVQAITASTISSRAYCDAVIRAYNTYMEGGEK
jgi:electron transport complex protein RnfG